MPEEETKLPSILDSTKLDAFPAIVEEERQLLKRAAELYNLHFCDYALLGVWNAAVHNLKRRVESYGVDLWISVVQDEAGRKKYDKDGESLPERWEGVDDLVLISGATKLALLNKKAGKSLEMINWMRNHASAAHENNQKVEPEDVFAFALMLQKNLFEAPLPDPGHSVSSLFEPTKNSSLTNEQIELFKDEIKALRNQDVRICFGFMLDILCGSDEPGITNVMELLPEVWERTNEDLRKVAGIKFHALTFETNSPATRSSKNARNRLLDFLTKVGGIKYIPDAARAQLYRHLGKKLSAAKDTAYGWRDEEVVAKALAQFGPHVPSVAFEEVYQEILTVWCGNYWGRSSCNVILVDFINQLSVDQVRQVVDMFRKNERVRGELLQNAPKKNAINLLSSLEQKLSIETQKEEVRRTIKDIQYLPK